MKKMILFLAVFTLSVYYFLPRANAELSDADKNFLLNQCQVSQADIDIIPKLDKDTQAKISAWIAAKDCNELVSFKETRDYYRRVLKLKPGESLPHAPSRLNWDYVTNDEFVNYANILKTLNPE